MRFFSLSSGHSYSVEDAVAGINDHAVADGEPRGNRGKTARSPQQGHRPQFCAAGSHDEDVPVITLPKKSAGRHYRRALLAEDSNARIHLVGVTQAPPSFGGRSNVH